MTLFYGEARNCALCGASSEQFALSSTNALGSPDLDLRPPPMQRDTMEFWLQECPKCGYINDDIQRELFGAKEVVNSASYRSLCAPQPVPVLASRFERFALLKQTVLPVEAGWARLHAAWVCDDHRKKGRAMEHRKACAEIWSKVAWAEDEE